MNIEQQIEQIKFLYNLDQTSMNFEFIEGETINLFVMDDLNMFFICRNNNLAAYIIIENKQTDGYYLIKDAKNIIKFHGLLHLIMIGITINGFLIKIDNVENLSKDFLILLTKWMTTGCHGLSISNQPDEYIKYNFLSREKFEIKDYEKKPPAEIFIGPGRNTKEFWDNDKFKWRRGSLIMPYTNYIGNKFLW